MSRFKFYKNKPKLTEQEILQHMDFDKFIAGHTPAGKGWFSAGARLYTLLAAGTAIIATVILLLVNSNKPSPEAEQAFIQPPIPALNKIPDSYIAETSAETTFVYSTGSTITIPASAFIDGNGNEVKGKVEIRYREFHDPIDILLSGIPMNYDSAGTSYQLESAGMFEIMAFRDGKPVFLKPGHEVLVNMISSNNNPTDFNVYNLDTTAKKWNYVSENTTLNKTCINLFNHVPLPLSVDAPILQSGTTPLQKPVLPKRRDPKRDNFSIDFLASEFPELSAFEGLKFEPVNTEKTDRAALAKRTWEDVVITRHPDNEHYNITFKSGKESHTFKVAPVVDEKDYAATLREYDRKLRAYDILLAQRKTGENKSADSLFRANEAFRGLAMSSDLNARFDSFVNDSYNETSRDLLAYRTFSISKLGIWNCDRPYPFFVKTGQNASGACQASFVTEQNDPVLLKMVYLIKRSVNSIYNVSPAGFDQFPDCEGAVDVVVGISYDNQIYYLKGEELPKKENGSKLRFRMKKPAAEITSAEQLKNLLKI